MIRKIVKPLIAVSLAVLAAGSITVFSLAMISPGKKYDPGKVDLNVKLLAREEVLACAYKVYGDDRQPYWVAKSVIKNVGKMPAYDLVISYKVGEYCDWYAATPYPELLPGETVRDFCWPDLDGDKVTKITTKTPVELAMKYEYRGQTKPVEVHEKIYLLGKNDFVYSNLADEDVLTGDDAISWHDWFNNFPFIAAFVTPNEESTKAFAQECAAGLQPKADDGDAIQTLLNIFDGFREIGVRYIHEPRSFWSSNDAQYVQYPADTLRRESGTCLDLAVAFAAMTEAVGIKSYVVFLPGHAVPMIELPESGDLVPIEATAIEDTEFITTADHWIPSAQESIDEAKAEDKYLPVDLETCWENGMMPSW